MMVKLVKNWRRGSQFREKTPAKQTGVFSLT